MVIALLVVMASVIIILIIKLVRSRAAASEAMRHTQHVREEFFGNIAHELLSPLTIISGLAAELRGNEEVEKIASVMKRHSDNLLALIEQYPSRDHRHKTLVGEKPSMTAAEKEFLAGVNDQIYQLMKTRQVGVEALAAALNLSRTQLNRRLLTLTDTNASAYITAVRMARARQLMDSDSNMLISDIAFRCGYEDIAYFSRVFKQVVGITPTQYRRQP